MKISDNTKRNIEIASSLMSILGVIVSIYFYRQTLVLMAKNAEAEVAKVV